MGISHSFDSFSYYINAIYLIFLWFVMVGESTHVNTLCFGFSYDIDSFDCLMDYSTEK